MVKQNGNRSDRRMPVKTEKIKLKDEWEGWEFTARVNPPLGLWTSNMGNISAMDPEHPETVVTGINSMTVVLRSMIIDWNFVDEQGLPLPLPEGIDQLPMELIAAAFEAVAENVNQAPLVPSSSSPSS